jgi:flagellin-like hook-associated protein FlgL
MVINTNIAAMSSARLLSQSSNLLSASLARLSSGSKIVNPSDDAAGLAVSMKFQAQINRIGAATSNVGNALSFNQTQDGFLQKVGSALDRMSELALMAQDATKTDSDRGLYNQEFTQLQSYINDLATKTFNGVSLFSSSNLNVTTDSDGHTFSNQGINLGASAYTTATTASQSSIDTIGHPIGVGSRHRGRKHVRAPELQRPTRRALGQSDRRQQPHHRCGRGAGEHSIRPLPDPGGIGYSHVGTSQYTTAKRPQAFGINRLLALTPRNDRSGPKGKTDSSRQAQ